MSTSSPVGPATFNVLGEPLLICGCEPKTGWYRNGFCETDPSDRGQHSICCVMTEAFLRYSKALGNDLSTPVPALIFPVFNLETTGASVHPAGSRLTTTEWHLWFD